MKLAVISSSVLKTPPDTYGGLEAFVYDLCCGISQSDWDITLFALEGSKAPRGVELFPTPETSDFGQRAYEMYKDQLRDFDVISDHSHNKWAYLQDVPITGTMHGVQTWSGIPPSNLSHLRPVQLPKKYPRLIAISQWQATDTVKRYGKDSLVIHLCVDTEKYTPEYDKDNKLLCMGVMLPHKGHDTAINAAKIANVPIDIAGETEFGTNQEYKERINSLIEPDIGSYYAGKRPDIIMWGTVSHDTKVNLLQRSKALLLPSKVDEAWSLLALESLACGTPVIASNSGALPEIIEHGVNGFIVNTSDPVEWARYIQKVDTIDNHKCRQTVEERFSIPIISKQYLHTFDRIVEGVKW